MKATTVRRPNHREVTAVKRGDAAFVQALGRRDHRCIDRTERKIAIRVYEFCDAEPVARSDGLDAQVSAG